MALMRPTGPLNTGSMLSGSFGSGLSPPKPPPPPPSPADWMVFVGPAALANSGYISDAASTDVEGQPPLVGTHAATILPVCPKQSSSLPGTSVRCPPPLCDGI